jgi:hypothetical protein
VLMSPFFSLLFKCCFLPILPGMSVFPNNHLLALLCSLLTIYYFSSFGFYFYYIPSSFLRQYQGWIQSLALPLNHTLRPFISLSWGVGWGLAPFLLHPTSYDMQFFMVIQLWVFKKKKNFSFAFLFFWTRKGI